MKINDKENDEMKDWKDADSSLSAILRSIFGLAVLFSWKFVFIINLNILRLVYFCRFSEILLYSFYHCLVPVMKK
jgi:hypothetical protein